MGSPIKPYILDLDKLKYLFRFDKVITPTEENMIINAKSKIDYYNSIKSDFEVNIDSLPQNKTFQYLQSIDKIQPIDNLKNTNKPVLIINSKNDFEVTEKHYTEWNSLLPKENIKILHLDQLNHIMSQSDNNSHPKDYRNEAPISFTIFNSINKWVTNE